MFAPNILFASLIYLLGINPFVAAVPAISAVGSKFFTSDGDQYFVKGVAYQLSPYDPLVNTTQCQLDASLMMTLGANAIRVYHVDPDQDHDGCMSAFEKAGIYLFLDLDTFSTMIVARNPTFNESQFASFAKVLDSFQQYENLAGVFVGNEVLTTPTDTPAAPYVKAAAAEIKAYRDRQNYRKIPVGYSAADIASLRPMLQNYLVCGSDDSEAIDFFGLNAYEWCGNDATYETSGYAGLQQMAKGYPKPIFFSETGCNAVHPRSWSDMGAIFGPNMSETWSGAIAYEWIEETNNYGLVSYGPGGPGNLPQGGVPNPVSLDFSNLKTAWASAKPISSSLSYYLQHRESMVTPPCPEYTSGTWDISGNPPLPTLAGSYSPSMMPTALTTVSSSLYATEVSTASSMTDTTSPTAPPTVPPTESKKSLGVRSFRDRTALEAAIMIGGVITLSCIMLSSGLYV